jgi:hypothetical protein
LAALAQVTDHDLHVPEVLTGYHDILLFIVAFPDSREVHRAAEGELRRTARIVREFAADEKERLIGTGIAHSEVRASFSRGLTRWLIDRFGNDVSIDWKDDSAGDGLDQAMRLLLAPVERDGLLAGRTTRQVLWLAGGRHDELRWLLDRIEHLTDDFGLLDQMWDGIALPLNWSLGSPKSSTTRTRLLPRQVAYFSGGLYRPRSLNDYQLPAPVGRLPSREAQPILDVCKAALAARGRETDTVTGSNPAETYFFGLDRGLDIVVIGMLPGLRLPIESYFGFLAARNRVPVAYGGGWVFFDRCEIGINVFEPFRGGESLDTLARVVGVYRSLFRPRLVTVPPNQIGDDNEEAIASGAYWAYDRLGFRPTDAETSALANRERTRRQSSGSYRTPPSVLRRLALSRLTLRLEGATPAQPLEVQSVSEMAMRWIGERHGGKVEKARRAAVNRVNEVLGVNDLHRWPPNQRRAYEDLSLLMASIPDLARWPEPDKKELALVMRAKGGPLERTFALRLQRHRRLYNSWLRPTGG